MKILELNFAAFGPFSKRVLAFDGAGLHIVYGPNEAGKSSALRGLRALLYGIEERTLDNFVHANDKLRIAGWLRTVAGAELRFVRRKGRKNTLLSAAGEALDEQLLTPFLQGVTSQLFETLFGIDHQALVQGGEEILQQKGEVGQALFSAALGSHALHAVLARLDEEADALFRPKGSKQAINVALKSYAELNKAVRDSSLPSREWEEQRCALERTAKALDAIQSELAGKRMEVNRLQRIRRVLPKLARRRELLQELEFLGDVVVLAADFTERRQQTVNSLEMAQAIVGKASPRLAGLQKQLAALSINRELLNQAENIEDLHARLGGHRKTLRERPHLLAESQQQLAEAKSLLKEIRPDLDMSAIELLRPILANRQTISESGSKNAVLLSRMEQAELNLHKTENLLKIAREAHAGIPETDSPEALFRAIAAARKEGDLDGAIQAAQSELTGVQAACAADLSRLTLWEGTFDEIARLGLPNRESINRYEAMYDELKADSQRLEKEQEKTANALKETLLNLDAIQRVGKVPTEADLTDSRSGRDQVWQLLRRHWIGGEDVSAEAAQYLAEGTLPEVFESRLVDADKLADRLRREADRVHAIASLQARKEAGQRQTDEITGQLAAYGVGKQRLDAEWGALWASSGIVPHTPREMRVWLDEFEKLRDRVGELSVLRGKTGVLEQTRRTHIQFLDRKLAEQGTAGSTSDMLETVLLESEACAQQLDEARRKRQTLDKEVKARAADVQSFDEERRLAMQAHAAWKHQWGKLMQRFGLQVDVSLPEASDYIEKVRTLFALQDEVEKLRIRIKAIDEEAASFRSQVQSIIVAIAPDTGDLPADDAVMHLNSLLAETRSRETRRQQFEEQVEQVQQEIRDSEASIRTMTERLNTLCVEAKCEGWSEIQEVESKSAHYLRVSEALDSNENEILETGEGASVAELEAETEGAEPDRLPGRIDELRSRIEDLLEPKRTELAQAKGSEETKLALMDGSDQAATLADQAQATLATIRADAERYVRVKLASRILRDQIEHYRKENQGPLVRRAGEHFATLTLGSFAGLTTDFNERDEPVLAGVRSSGEQVYVEGMSSGTRDQLYLALRLASLEKYMESSEPMPFIVDDVLVDFDDERSQAALNALATLADTMQVILFTHHTRVVEQAKQLQTPVQLHVL